MTKEEIESVEAFINSEITAKDLQPLVPTFPVKEENQNG
jgi:hypothetical protein